MRIHPYRRLYTTLLGFMILILGAFGWVFFRTTSRLVNTEAPPTPRALADCIRLILAKQGGLEHWDSAAFEARHEVLPSHQYQLAKDLFQLVRAQQSAAQLLYFRAFRSRARTTETRATGIDLALQRFPSGEEGPPPDQIYTRWRLSGTLEWHPLSGEERIPEGKAFDLLSVSYPAELVDGLISGQPEYDLLLRTVLLAGTDSPSPIVRIRHGKSTTYVDCLKNQLINEKAHRAFVVQPFPPLPPIHD